MAIITVTHSQIPPVEHGSDKIALKRQYLKIGPFDRKLRSIRPIIAIRKYYRHFGHGRHTSTLYTANR